MTHMTQPTHTTHRISTRTARAILLIASTSIATLACGKPEGMPVPPTAVPVTTALVQLQTIPMDAEFPGIVASPRSIAIDARVEGFLLKQEVADGSPTNPDQVIYRIDPRPFEASLASAQGSLVQAIASRDYARKEMDRNAPLVPSNAISQQSFDQLVSNFEVAEGEVLTAQANVVTAKINLSYCTMSSPFRGLLGPSKFFEGAVVGRANAQNLNTLVQIDPLWVQFSPSATHWPNFSALMAKGPIKATLTYDGSPGITASGNVIFADNQVSTSTGTLMMRVEFSNPNLVFRPGVYSQVTVVLGDIPNTMVVPMDSIFAREADLYVWRVKPDNTVESVLVTVLKKFDKSFALKSGPNPGDRIVVDGIQRLKLGSKINDVTAKSAAPAVTPKASAPAAPAATPKASAPAAPAAPAAAPAPATK